MSTDQGGLAGFSAMLREALGDLIGPGGESFAEMFAEDGVMEFPYAPPGGVRRLDGRAAVAAYMPGIDSLIRFDRFTAPTIYRTTDPGVVILDYEGFGQGVATGLPYEQRYLSVITARDGRIAHYLDFWDPIVALRAVGGDAAMAAALGAGGGDGE